MEWYYANNNTQFGPVPEAEIQRKLQSGELLPSDVVWREGMSDWLACSSVPEFAMLRSPLASFAPTAPPTGGSAVSPYAPPQVLTSNFPATATSGLAIGAMVMGILGLLLCQLLSIGGVVCGHMALNELNRPGNRLGGRGMAIAGLVTGYIGLLIIGVFLVIILMAAVGGSAGRSF